ncbi:cAMP phosphodiesterases class-II-domain-containing protein [Roridomyces roridus]|uniref:cAMP phosphodiesterases class-II-domain-containing protein n=1 Tax=Roridomyces roridus TaxID=1738132 RepID=A0AAD7BVR5_9AGAR|nr:cAMP phosphodiesterases class-II-domain-containing protein [Roridomyces roridus]
MSHGVESSVGFDLVCVGDGGGPDETNLSAYLLKPSAAAWEDGVIALEAGSGQGALQKLLRHDPHIFDETKRYSASEIYSFVRCFLITHAHLDHIQSLVISAGSLTGPRKRIHSARQTLEDLESVFSDRIWPNLASWDEEDDEHKLLYTALAMNDTYDTLIPNVSVRGFPVSHGHNDRGNYDSAAFFIRYDPTGHEFLFFGDLEPDALSLAPRTIHVWRAAAPKIPTSLATIFIECSWPSTRSDDALYGHLKPEYLVKELEALATEVVKVRNAAQSSPTRPVRKKQRLNPAPPPPIDVRGALAGLRVFVIHCKDTLDGAPDRPNQTLILEQIKALVEEKGLGAEILAARQGMHIQI